METSNPAREVAIQDPIRRMEWEEAPIPGESNPTIRPDKGRALDGRSDPTHPLVRGRTKGGIKKTTFEIAETPDPATGEPVIDPVVFKSVSNMDWGV